MMESSMAMPNPCSATAKKQKQLQGITGNGAQAEIITASMLTSSIREQEGKGEEEDIYERQLNTKPLPPGLGSTKL